MNGSYTKRMLKRGKSISILSNNGVEDIMQKVCGRMGNDLPTEKEYLIIWKGVNNR